MSPSRPCSRSTTIGVESVPGRSGRRVPDPSIYGARGPPLRERDGFVVAGDNPGIVGRLMSDGGEGRRRRHCRAFPFVRPSPATISCRLRPPGLSLSLADAPKNTRRLRRAYTTTERDCRDSIIVVPATPDVPRPREASFSYISISFFLSRYRHAAYDRQIDKILLRYAFFHAPKGF